MASGWAEKAAHDGLADFFNGIGGKRTYAQAASLATARGALLDRWAWSVRVRTEHTAIAGQRSQLGPTASAIVEPDASVCRHGFGSHMPAVRAGEGGL